MSTRLERRSVRLLDCGEDSSTPGVFGKQLYDWETCCDALLKQPGERLVDAAHRALRRSKRMGRVTKRTQVAGIIAASHRPKSCDPWPGIERAAALWRGKS